MSKENKNQVQITSSTGHSVVIGVDEFDRLVAQADASKKLAIDDNLLIKNVYQLNDCRQLRFDCGGYSFALYYARDKFLAIPNHNLILDLSHEECSRSNLQRMLIEQVKTLHWNELHVDAILAAIFDVRLDGVDDRCFNDRLIALVEESYGI